jgi:hypothetical protein
MRVVAAIVIAALIGAVAFGQAPLSWIVPAPFLALGIVLSRRRCEHLYPALLPPMRRADGTVLPAKWVCCDCGDSWTAGRVEQTSHRRAMLS